MPCRGCGRSRGLDAGEDVGGGLVAGGRWIVVVEVGEHPGGGVSEVVVVVLDGGVLDSDAEALEKLVEVVAVLVLLGLAEDDEAAAAAYEGLDVLELGGGEAGVAAVDGGLPLRLGGVSDDEHVGWCERFAGQRAVVVRCDLEVALGERRGGTGEGGVGGMGGLNLARELGANGPGFGVRLVEEDAGEFRVRGHGRKVEGRTGVVNGASAAHPRNNSTHGRD
jgi:hypothetical protein